MTNATKTLLIIFVSLAVLTALVKWTSGPASSEAFRSTIADVNTEQVNHIRIEKPTEDQVILLKEEPSGWTVAKGDGGTAFAADSSLIKRALENIAQLNVRAVATRDPQKFTRYKADSTGIKVSLFNGDELLAGVIIGATQFVSQREFNNYVRPVGEDVVYSVEGFLESSFGRDLSDWREKDVWDIARDNITRVDFLLPADSSYSIERADDEQNWISEGDTLNQTQIHSILRQLSSLRANGFADSLSTSTFGTEQYAIQFQLKEGAGKTIRLKPDDRDDTRFVAVATGYPYVFTLNRSNWENSVLKSREELLE